MKTMLLESGDAVIFGGSSRMRFHGIRRIRPLAEVVAVLSERTMRTDERRA